MSYTYGTKAPAIYYTSVPNDEVATNGSIYRFRFALSGIKTYLPYWEENAAADLISQIETQYPGFTVTYLNINSDTKMAELQAKYTSYAQSGEYAAMVAPAILWGIVLISVSAVALYFTMQIVGTISKAVTTLFPGPGEEGLSFGSVVVVVAVVAGIFGAGYLIKQLKSGSSQSRPYYGSEFDYYDSGDDLFYEV